MPSPRKSRFVDSPLPVAGSTAENQEDGHGQTRRGQSAGQYDSESWRGRNRIAGVEALAEAKVSGGCVNIDQDAQDNQDCPGPERARAGNHSLPSNQSNLSKEKAEPGHDETKAHHGQAGPDPGQQGPLSSEENAWVAVGCHARILTARPARGPEPFWNFLSSRRLFRHTANPLMRRSMLRFLAVSILALLGTPLVMHVVFHDLHHEEHHADASSYTSSLVHNGHEHPILSTTTPRLSLRSLSSTKPFSLSTSTDGSMVRRIPDERNIMAFGALRLDHDIGPQSLLSTFQI